MRAGANRSPVFGRWATFCGYWAAVGTAMFADGSLGWDDVLLGIVALVAWRPWRHK